NPIFALAIVDKFGKQYLGSCGLSLIDEYKRYEIFYSLLYRYWGNGYAIEAVKTLFNYAFNQSEVKNMVAYINPKNSRSWKVAERSGMMYLGQITHKETKEKAMYYVITKKEFKRQNYY
ncbi:MAG: GNAT family N-acetyltransferase, partial [Candidatus Lokiarchaeota archaeon]|nr:GNAT family N-acetyltransferase [Candidatus Lokiarchaeota archaeon]MBD3202557.1 GNAT family N-acetyltransferase [Candidatus Lokiarchaeota archaeon]